ncbi:MAG: hypothetical protein KME20_21485 [Kaiparowitsia implicata GSE-PSE-MK54-09C]|nr:hypothetical protein [Kaiparowitsia implicata GSE-PSE-MK54-09C]
MGLFNRLSSRLRKSSAPAVQPAQAAQGQIVPAQPLKSKTLAELERQIELESRRNRPITVQAVPVRRNGWMGKLLSLSLLVGLPLGALWLINLPYAPIRRPIAENAPILLLPSYIQFDNNFKEAIALSEQATQLIDNPTSSVDLDVGQVVVRQAQERLDALPSTLRDSWHDDWYRWYGWRYSSTYFNDIRSEVGRLQVKVMQEQNAQTALVKAEQAIAQARQAYQQAQTPTDRRMAIEAWRKALSDLELIPSQTLAGDAASLKYGEASEQFRETVGIAAESEKVAVLIDNARQFAWQAAKAAQNPPHTVTEWDQIIRLWQLAISRLDNIRSDDLAGSAEAEQLLAQYEANLSEIKVRREAEADAIRLMREANHRIEQLTRLNAGSPSDFRRDYQISQLYSIINTLNQISNGTTVYKDSELLLIQANNRLNQLSAR